MTIYSYNPNDNFSSGKERVLVERYISNEIPLYEDGIGRIFTEVGNYIADVEHEL